MSEKIRVDKYLWAIRVFKTRTQAAAACDAGKVRNLGTAVKASRMVSVGDEYEIRTSQRKWVIRVTGLLKQRLSPGEALQYYTDLTPVEEMQPKPSVATVFYTGKRESKIGRPTKKQRRNLDDLMDGAMD